MLSVHGPKTDHRSTIPKLNLPIIQYPLHWVLHRINNLIHINLLAFVAIIVYGFLNTDANREKKSVYYSHELVVTELVVSET